MENRKLITSVRALREKFELQAEENRSRSDLYKSGSQIKLATQLGSLHLNHSDEEVARPLTSPNPRLSIPLPPSVLPTQVLKPRPFSYSEATGSGSSEHDLFNSYVGSPPEKPPRTFLYDLLSDPSPELPSNILQPPSHGVSLRRKTPLAATLSVPFTTTQLNLGTANESQDGSHSIPVHRKAIYTSDTPIGANKRKKRTKPIRPPPFISSDHSTTREDSEQFSNWNGNHDPAYVSNDKYLSATREMTRIRERQSQAAHKISTANIRPIQVCSGNGSQFNGSLKVSHSPSPSPPPRLLRTQTEPDILSSSMTRRTWKPIPAYDSSEYGSIQGELSYDQPHDSVDSSRRSVVHQVSKQCSGFQNYLNPYYYPCGLILGPDGQFSREPIPSDHPNHFSVGILQNYHQFFDSENERNGNHYQGPASSASDKYDNFIRTYHPELEQNDQRAFFYRQGTSVTVVPPWQQSHYLSKFRSTSPYQNHSSSSFLSSEMGLWKHPVNLPTPPTRTFQGMTTGKSKSEWNLNEAAHDRHRPHSNQNFISTKAVFIHGNHQGQHLRSQASLHNNGSRQQTAIHQSVSSVSLFYILSFTTRILQFLN